MLHRPLVLLGVLASAVALYLGLESVRVSAPREEPALLGIRARDVVAIRVQEGSRELLAARTAAGWRIDVPLDAPPGAGASVAGLVETLVSLAPVDSFTRDNVDRSAFGLAPARARLELTVRGEVAPTVLYLGDYVPTGGSVYGMVSGDARIYLVGALIGTDLEKLFYHAQPGH